MPILFDSPYDQAHLSIAASTPTQEQAPYLFGEVSEAFDYKTSYLPSGGSSGPGWAYLASLLTLPLFDTYEEAKTTLMNRIFTSHACYANKEYAGEKFSTMMALFAQRQLTKGESFFPKDQVDDVIKLVQDDSPHLSQEDIIARLFPIPNYPLDAPFKKLRDNEAGRLLHAKLMERLAQYRDQEVKDMLTEAKTAFCALSILGCLAKLFEIVTLYYNTWLVKRSFEAIYNDQSDTKIINAGKPLM